MDVTQRCLTGVTSIFFFSVSVCLNAQQSSLSVSIKEDIKKDLLRQIKPSSLTKSPMQPYKSSSSAIREESLLEYSKRMTKSTAGEEFDDKYQVAPSILNITSDVPLNKLPDGHVTPEFINGKWVFTNTATRVDGLVIPSGLDLSGGGTKKISEKSKNILINVLGMEVDEKPIIPTKELIEKISSRPSKETK